MRQIRILLADDHAVLRDSLRAFLSMQPDIEVVGEAANGLETLSQVQALQPDLVLLDLAMPLLGGIEVTGRIRKEHPGCKVLVLTQHEVPDYVLPALQAGASGYLLKRAGGAEVVQAVRAVDRGESFLHTAIARLVIEAVQTERDVASQTLHGRLTCREREVLSLIAEGQSNSEIARALSISPKTVDKHRASLTEKLGIHSRAGLMRYALQKTGSAE